MRIPLRKEDIVIDCGANVGEVTTILARHGSKVFAFEPNPFAFKVLKEKFKKFRNVECIQAGIHTNNSKMKLYLHEWAQDDQIKWSTGSSVLAFKGNVSCKDYVEIDVIDFCDFINRFGKTIKLVKMDVEGIECEILNKMINTGVIHKIDYMFVERHDHKIPELKIAMEEIEQTLKKKKITNIYLDWI